MLARELKAECIVELIRTMRGLGLNPTPSYIMEIVEVIERAAFIEGLGKEGGLQTDIFVAPVWIDLSLSEDDFESPDGEQRFDAAARSVFAMLDHGNNITTIADKGRFKVRILSPREVNAEGLQLWYDHYNDLDEGGLGWEELSVRSRTYVVDVEAQIGYRIAFTRITSFQRGEIPVPALANKKVMVVGFELLRIDGTPVAISHDNPADSFFLGNDGRSDARKHSDIAQRSLDRIFDGKHVSRPVDNRDRIENADLLPRNKPFKADDFPLFFDDLVRFEILGERVDRCKRSLPRNE